MASDKKFAVIITLFTIIGLSLALAMLSMVLHDERVHSDGTFSGTRGAPPLQSLNFSGD